TFGPIMPVMKRETIDEAVELANDTEVGLSGAVFAGTIEEARAVGERINAGGISLNDTCMTYITSEPATDSFEYAGMGGSGLRPAGLMRVCRRKALIMERGAPLSLFDMSEDKARG